MLRHSSNSQTPFARGAGAWFHDALYLIASLFVWNWRKSRYQKSRGAMRCPCQSLSDSGRPGESRCEASYYLKDPRRFSIVCPALKTTANGLRCHHRLEDVRPYWGRTIIAVLIALTLIYGLAVTSAFGVVRTQGIASARWVDCAWPANWSNISVARATHHRTLAEIALARDDFHAAIRSLSRAVNAVPDRWADGLLLAKLYEQIGQFAASEELFQSLAQRFPENADHITAVHHDAVLTSQRYESLQELALNRITLPDSATSIPWIEALLFSTALSDTPTTVWTTFPAHCDQLTIDHRILLSIVAPPENSEAPELTQEILNHDFENPRLAAFRWKLLWLTGKSEIAQTAFRKDEPLIPAYESSLARWLIASPSVPSFIAKSDWGDIALTASSENQFSLLLATALDAETLVPLNVVANRIPANNSNLTASLWVMAALQGEIDLASELAERLATNGHPKLPNITPDSRHSELGEVLARFSIPRHLSYSLMRYAQLNREIDQRKP
jgi:tetratricopeptide (TPR) repeat protein